MSGAIEILFHVGVRDLLRVEAPDGRVVYPLTRRSSIKDIIEALGVPHVEVGRIVAEGREHDFHLIPEVGDRLEIYPFTRDVSILTPTLLRSEPFTNDVLFLADSTVLRLARNLRMAGVDTEIAPNGGLREIAGAAGRMQRIILTRNRDLLKIGTVVFGQLLRSEDHLVQLAEVIDRYDMLTRLRPFSRCLHCNSILAHVAKEEILALLLPLTRKYYHDFKRCMVCRRIYWRGSHHQRMLEMLRNLS